MTDQSRTNQELIEEISVLKQKNKELEQAKTERKLVEESLKQSEAHYRLLADHMKDHVWIMDLNLKPTYISPSVEKSRGYTLEEIAQLPLDKHLTATSLQSAIEFFSLEMPKALADPTYYLMQSLELEFYRKDGSTFWLENMFSLIRDENGKPMSLLGVGRDITDQKQAEKARRESEELFRLLFNTINDAVFLHYGPSPDGFPGRFIEVNDIACERLGYSHDELLRMSPLDIDDPDTVKAIPRMMEKLNRDKVAIWEGIHLTKDGRRIPVEINNQLIDFKGIPAILSTARDITDRKRAWEALRESESRFRHLLQNIPNVAVQGYGPGGMTQYWNRASEVLYGYTEQEAIGRNLMDLIIPQEMRGDVEKAIRQMADTGEPIPASELSLMRKDGSRVAVFSSHAIVQLPGREPELFCIDIDLTERKQAEEAFSESEERFRMLAENARDTIWTMDMNLQYTYMSPYVKKILNYTPEEYMALPLNEVLTPSSLELCMQVFAEEVEVEKRDDKDLLRSRTIEVEHIDKNGKTVPVEIKLTFMRNNAGVATGILGYTGDITERKRAEKVLREQEIKLSSIFRAAPVGIGMVINRMLQEGNDTLCQMTGYSREELLGQNSRMLYPTQEDYDFVGQEKYRQIGEKRTGSVETLWKRKDGTVIDIILSSTPLDPDDLAKGVTFTALDITARKQAEEHKRSLEERLRHADKMEAIGTMSGGIAHDFNNILGIIVGYTEMALNEKQKEKQEQYLLKTLEGAERAKDVIKQLLTYSRKDSHEKKPLDLKLLLKEAVKFIRASIPATIEIRQHLTKDSCNIMADPTQMHQVVMNLCSNAAHAMKRTGGILKIELSNVEMPQGDLPMHRDLKPGHYAKLTVIDTGHGIAPDMQQYIFDPFFTTKSKEEGTGLGLSVVYGIVKAHNGNINVHSQTDKGATFNIYLPLIIHAETVKMDTGKPVTGGTERILFVDDEPALVDLGTRMLSSLGYEVTGVTSSVEALHLLLSEPQRFDLVITDMTLPKMTGIVLSRKILKIRPDIPIILCSGVRERETEEKAKSLGIRAYLTKPIAIRELSRVIRDTLNGHDKHIS